MIFPYDMKSSSAKLLAEALGVKRIKKEGSNFKGNPNKVVINYGSSIVTEEVAKCNIFNSPEAVSTASNKLSFFEKVKGIVNIPEFTTNKDVAKLWLSEGSAVLARTKLNGHSGEGIYVLEDVKDFEPLLGLGNAVKIYVRYIPKKDEYRVHVVNGEVIDVRRKALNPGWNKNDVNWKVRNHNNGFIFAKSGFKTPTPVLEESIKAVLVCGLDFGAVDVIWNEFRKKAFVLEINTAPGLEGSSVETYAKAFEKFYENPEDKLQKEYLKMFKAQNKLAVDHSEVWDAYKKAYPKKPIKASVFAPQNNHDDEIEIFLGGEEEDF